MKELWKSIPNYECWYSVSNLGNIRRNKKASGTQVGRILKKSINPKGYRIVSINNANIPTKTFKVSCLVALTFISKREKSKVINHKNGIKTDDRVINLEYITQSMNVIHAYEVLGHKAPSGKNHWNGKKIKCINGHNYSFDNTSISNGRRICKICRKNNKKLRRLNEIQSSDAQR